MNNKKYDERQYREDVKKAALIQMDKFKHETSNPECGTEFQYGDEVSERVSATAQLCIAANLIKLNETLDNIYDIMLKQ